MLYTVFDTDSHRVFFSPLKKCSLEWNEKIVYKIQAREKSTRISICSESDSPSLLLIWEKRQPFALRVWKKVIEMMLLKNVISCLILSSQAPPSLKLNESWQPCRPSALQFNSVEWIKKKSDQYITEPHSPQSDDILFTVKWSFELSNTN